MPRSARRGPRLQCRGHPATALNNANSPNSIAVTLSRTTGATGAVTVGVSVTGGTLVNGTDYNTFTSPTPVNFADGVTTAQVNLQLKAIAPNKLPGTIVLGLANPTGGATLGAVTATTVTVTSPGLLAWNAPTFKFAPLDSHAAPNDLALTLSRASGSTVRSPSMPRSAAVRWSTARTITRLPTRPR